MRGNISIKKPLLTVGLITTSSLHARFNTLKDVRDECVTQTETSAVHMAFDDGPRGAGSLSQFISIQIPQRYFRVSSVRKLPKQERLQMHPWMFFAS